MVCEILQGDCREVLKRLDPDSVHCVVTSPPYFNLRDYGVDGQIGLETSPDEFVVALVDVFREVRRVLRDDGTCWLNLGDSYTGGGCGARDPDKWPKQSRNDHMPRHAKRHTGLKSKDLIGIPWMTAFALRADGWYLRQDIIWAKPNPMPESVRDRCTKSHEYLFLLTKSERYHYDTDAVREVAVKGAAGSSFDGGKTAIHQLGRSSQRMRVEDGMRNRRSVWTVSTEPFAGAHFATMPSELVKPCILAGCPVGGIVLDPFAGAGTTGVVAERLGRNSTLIELNPEYCRIAADRIRGDLGRVESELLQRPADHVPLFADAGE